MIPMAQLSSLLLALVLVVDPVSAVVTIPISRHINTANSLNILKQDHARAFHIATGISGRGGESEPVVNQLVTYTANVSIGIPPTYYTLLVDTGSANTWVGANKTYVKTASSVKTNQTVRARYGSGNFSGFEYTDTVALGDVVIRNQSIGVATSAYGFNSVDGILGVGPADLTIGTLFPDNTTAIPTVTDNAFSQGIISAHEIGISYEPSSSGPTQNGEITWGGIDETKFTGPLHYAPISNSFPADRYWGINQTVSYGSMPIMNNSQGIVDTGTTLILLPTTSFQLYQNATGAVLNSTVGLLQISSDQYDALKPLDFHINGRTFTLTPNAQIWPRVLNTQIGGQPNDIFLIVQQLFGAVNKIGFINGYTWLERFYTVYDATNKRVGFATTPFTTATTN